MQLGVFVEKEYYSKYERPEKFTVLPVHVFDEFVELLFREDIFTIELYLRMIIHQYMAYGCKENKDFLPPGINERLLLHTGYTIILHNITGFWKDIRCLRKDFLNDFFMDKEENAHFDRILKDLTFIEEEDWVGRLDDAHAWIKGQYSDMEVLMVVDRTVIRELIEKIWVTKSSKYDMWHELIDKINIDIRPGKREIEITFEYHHNVYDDISSKHGPAPN